MQHKIDTGDHKIIKQAPRRLPLNKRETAEKEVKAMLTNNIFEPSTSAWSSSVVLVEKKDHSTRFCVDYRAQNDITSKDSYPLPRIDDCFDALGGTTWFSSIDLQSGYWQVAMDPDSIDKTAFSCHSGLFSSGFSHLELIMDPHVPAPHGTCFVRVTVENIPSLSR